MILVNYIIIKLLLQKFLIVLRLKWLKDLIKLDRKLIIHLHLLVGTLNMTEDTYQLLGGFFSPAQQYS